MKELEQPSIELYMYSLNQEYPTDVKNTNTKLKNSKIQTGIKSYDKARESLKTKIKDWITDVSSDDDGGDPDGGNPDGGDPADGGSPSGGTPDGGTPDGGTPWDGKVTWAIKFSVYRPGEDVMNPAANMKQQRITKALLRKEDFGGILYDTVNDHVYKLNASGYSLAQELISAAIQGLDINKFETDIYDKNSVKKFVSFLKVAELCM